jgi:hypothetical protein
MNETICLSEVRGTFPLSWQSHWRNRAGDDFRPLVEQFNPQAGLAAAGAGVSCTMEFRALADARGAREALLQRCGRYYRARNGMRYR